ncbi:gliding motility-associated protein GldE [Bernardetia litoralis DSM 6794]|uniref:Gliding motility-associated protein GldE n=1 Tax=Bernardetia litoralis (strain ATCC 23117 / DSM 6794 / NBRC 15988 / NCIMB 1366 / Fx l1 / Sio-4) TaxID=880071 RepID=I4AKI8_BERLS|nr:gliding motility-associated protein GldE [Bernardetia litoralis]AFM04473.1 gliding motility-associated protein GldE [Bernardetia litoralis DSM 6794]
MNDSDSFSWNIINNLDNFHGLDALLQINSIQASSLVMYAFELFIILILLLLSGLISGSEVAFFSLTTQQIEECKDSEKLVDKKLLQLLSKQKLLLATILLLNNLINIAIVIASTYMMWQIFGREEEGLVVVILTAIVTAAIVFFGEVVPKVIARQRSLLFSRSVARPMAFAITIFRPAAWILAFMGERLEKSVKKGQNQTPVSVEQLNKALELTTNNEAAKEARQILRGVINFGQINAKQIMTSRTEITAVEYSTSYNNLLETIKESGYSRIPIYKEKMDDITGLLYAKDLLAHLREGSDFEWQELIRENVFYVPETKKIDDLFQDFQSKHIHMAIVVDEYGGTSGLVTLEDVIEEIVGEINDEFDDEEEKLFIRTAEDEYIFEGKTLLSDFVKEFELHGSHFDTVKGESESIGGLMLELFSKMPMRGETKEFPPFEFTIESADRKRVKKVKVRVLKQEDQEDED